MIRPSILEEGAGMIHDPKDASLFPRLPEQEVRNLARYGSEVRL